MLMILIDADSMICIFHVFQVRRIYQDSSIGNAIDVSVVKMIILKEPQVTSLMFISGLILYQAHGDVACLDEVKSLPLFK